MRGGTQRLAVWMAVGCFAAPACAAAADRHAGRTANTDVVPAGEPLAVKVGGDARALAVVNTPLRPVAHVHKGPPRVVLRRTFSANAPLRVGLIGDSVAYSLLLTLGATGADLEQRYHVPFAATSAFQGPGFGLTADVEGYNDIGPTAPASAYAGWLDSV